MKELDLCAIKKSYKSVAQVATIWHFPAPTNSGDYGEEGWMSYDVNYHYIYVNNRWLRHAISAFQPF